MQAEAAVKNPIRAVRVELRPNYSSRVFSLVIVCDGDMPEVIMYNGDPYVPDHGADHYHAYRQVTPYRALG